MNQSLELYLDQKSEKERVKHSDIELSEQIITETYKGLKVLGLVADHSACGYYRIINPLHMLKLHGADVSYGVFQSNQNFNYYDIIIAPRQHNPEILDTFNRIKWENKLPIYEVDDDFWSVSPSSPAYNVYHPGSPELLTIAKFCRECYGVTTTTLECAKWYSQYNQNVAIVENHIDYSFRDWGMEVEWNGLGVMLKPKELVRPEDWGDKVVICWAGGTTHQKDLSEIGPTIHSILSSRDDALFAFYGSVVMYEQFVQLYKLPIDKVRLIKARHFLDYPKGLHGIDIGLAPIEPSQFNLAKSDLRPKEINAVGAAAVCSNFGPYARYLNKHPDAGIKVGKGRECYGSWAEALSYLLDNKEKLKQMKDVARTVVAKNYSLEGNFHQWPKAWNEIYSRKNQGIIGPPALKQNYGAYRSFGITKPKMSCPCKVEINGKVLPYGKCCQTAFG